MTFLHPHVKFCRFMHQPILCRNLYITLQAILSSFKYDTQLHHNLRHRLSKSIDVVNLCFGCQMH